MTNNADIVRQLLALLTDAQASATQTSAASAPSPSTVVGHYCIVRCKDAGVHAGIVEAIDGRSCLLRDARRLWSWRVPMGAPSFLSGVATHGIDTAHSKVGTPISVLLTETCEIIPCMPTAQKSIEAAPEVERTQ